MPISRKRKKNGKKVKGHRGTIKVDPNAESGVTLQDLINTLAYQEYKAAGVYDVETEGLELADITPNFEAPEAQAVIQAVHEASKYKVNEKENTDER